MANQNADTPTKIPPDKDEFYDTSPMQLSTVKMGKTRPDRAELIKQRADTNLAAIINLVEVQISLESDREILTILENQRANLLEIFKKKSGKECNFKTIETKAFSELQGKFSSLEKSVDQKLNTILRSIESNQSTVSSWAQIAAQNSQKEQKQQQETAAAKVQKQIPEKTQEQAQKQTQKQVQNQDHDSYLARRLILHVKSEMWKDFNSYNLRNQINDIFEQKMNVKNPVIASVTKSKTGLSIVLTTMPEFSADFLLKNQQIWKNLFSHNLKLVEKSTKWYKIVVHGVPVRPFSTSDGLTVLRNEIETFNPYLKLLRDPNWLSSEENRQAKRHASIVFAVDNEEQAKKAIKNQLYIAGLQLVAESYKQANEKTQCQKCQKLGHSTRSCLGQEYCQICAEKHHTRQHKCLICQTIEVECPHSKLKCRNCGENHKANSQVCSIWNKLSAQESVSPAKSDVTMQNSSDFSVVISNARK
jgi:hypothetical protein